jgi:hypothetical protein
VPGILEQGLALGGANAGVMDTSADMTPWPDVAYGCLPVFVFLAPSYRDNYSWDMPGGEPEEPVWLEVDLAGLALYADFWELREVTEAAVSDVGFWWGNWHPDPESAPEPVGFIYSIPLQIHRIGRPDRVFEPHGPP